MSVLLFVGVFRAALEADSVSCRMAVSATGSRPLERRLLSERQTQKDVQLGSKWQKDTKKLVKSNRKRLFNVFCTNCAAFLVRSSSFYIFHDCENLFVLSDVYRPSGGFLNLHRVHDVYWKVRSCRLVLPCRSLLILLCICCYVNQRLAFQSTHSLLEVGLPPPSDRTVGFFSVTSTLDGERRGESPGRHHNVLMSVSISSPCSFLLCSHRVTDRFTRFRTDYYARPSGVSYLETARL